jgi:hypothetical protein
MAMMTVRKRAVLEPPWSPATLARASARGLKSARGPKSAGGPDIRHGQVERRCDEATCLARQAGPGPRI